MIESRYVTVRDQRLHYLQAGEGSPVLLLHGWPTSAHLWRHCLDPIAARGRQAIALDLPGFGKSDKPLDSSYSFPFFERIIDGFLDVLEIDRLGMAVHDLGGPVGLYWASKRPDRLVDLALLNTIVFPEPSWAAALFVAATRMAGFRQLLSSPAGIRFAQTVARIAMLVPRAEVTGIENCGHFLQEDRPQEVARMLAGFFARFD
jgi:haloalkane dehalogenase